MLPEHLGAWQAASSVIASIIAQERAADDKILNLGSAIEVLRHLRGGEVAA